MGVEVGGERVRRSAGVGFGGRGLEVGSRDGAGGRSVGRSVGGRDGGSDPTYLQSNKTHTQQSM